MSKINPKKPQSEIQPESLAEEVKKMAKNSDKPIKDKDNSKLKKGKGNWKEELPIVRILNYINDQYEIRLDVVGMQLEV